MEHPQTFQSILTPPAPFSPQKHRTPASTLTQPKPPNQLKYTKPPSQLKPHKEFTNRDIGP